MHNTINPGQSRTVSLLCIPFNCRVSLYPPSILSFIRSSQIRHGRIKSIVMERAREGAALSRGEVAVGGRRGRGRQVTVGGRRGCGRQQVAGRGRRLPALRAAIQPRCVTTRWCALRHRCTYVAAWEMQFCRYGCWCPYCCCCYAAASVRPTIPSRWTQPHASISREGQYTESSLHLKSFDTIF